MSLNWNFQRSGGSNPPWGEYGYFLEQYIKVNVWKLRQDNKFVQGNSELVNFEPLCNSTPICQLLSPKVVLPSLQMAYSKP